MKSGKLGNENSELVSKVEVSKNSGNTSFSQSVARDAVSMHLSAPQLYPDSSRANSKLPRI